MMLASSPNCWSVLPSVARYFSGSDDQRAEREQDADDEGEDAVGGEQSVHVVTVSGWSASSALRLLARERRAAHRASATR